MSTGAQAQTDPVSPAEWARRFKARKAFPRQGAYDVDLPRLTMDATKALMAL